MSVILAAVDAVRDLMPLGTGMVADDTATEPFRVAPNRLYVWPRRAIAQRTDEAGGAPGRWPEADLQLRILYTLASKGEARVLKADRKVSQALDEALDDITEAIAAHRTHPLWWDMYVTNVVPDATRSIAARGVGVDVTVRINPGVDVGGSGS